MAHKNIGDDRPVRFCPLCQQMDDHPRHAKMFDQMNVAEHMDCCRTRGCPDGSCDVIGDVVGNLRGKRLLDALQDKADEIADKVAERVALFADPRSSAEIMADPNAEHLALNPDEAGEK